MSTYKGNAGHLMQHWTLCELLVAARKHTSGLNFIDAHAMAPLAKKPDPRPGSSGLLFDQVRRKLPGQSDYEQAWHKLDPNREGYPNSAAFVEKIWKGDFSMLLCEIDDATNEELKPWLANIGTLERCKRAKLFPDDWLKRFCKPLPSPCDVGLPDGSLTLVSFDPDRYDRRRLDADKRKSRHLYPGNLERTLRALPGAEGRVLIQLSTYSKGGNNPQDAVKVSVDGILAKGGFTRAAVVKLNEDMMSLVYSCNVSWSAELADLPVRFNEWLNGN